MKIRIGSDGKFSDRAFEIIKEKFQTEWIPAPCVQSTTAEDIVLPVSYCDLSISYVRHPDIVMALLDKQKPVIPGIIIRPGFLHQAKVINESIIAPVTMCSLDDGTLIQVISEFVRVFGRPYFNGTIDDDGTVPRILIHPGSLYGSTGVVTAELAGTRLDVKRLQHYGLRIVHFCRAQRFGKISNRVLSGWTYVRELLHAIKQASPITSQQLRPYVSDIHNILDQKTTGV